MVFRQAIEQLPEDADAFCWLGRVAHEQHRDKDAIEQFKRSSKLDKKNSAPHIGVGRAYLRMPKRRYDARTAFQRADKLGPDDADIQDYIGLTFANNLGKRREYGVDGRRYFRKAIELDPNDAAAYNNRGISYSDLGQYQRAIEDYDKAIELDPNDAESRTHRQRALRALDESAK